LEGEVKVVDWDLRYRWYFQTCLLGECGSLSVCITVRGFRSTDVKYSTPQTSLYLSQLGSFSTSMLRLQECRTKLSGYAPCTSRVQRSKPPLGRFMQPDRMYWRVDFVEKRRNGGAVIFEATVWSAVCYFLLGGL